MMKKSYCVICGKYRKFEKPTISYLLEKILVQCKNEDEKLFTVEETIEILKILGSVKNIILKIWLKKT